MIIGGVRGEEDEKLVRDIQDLCKYLSVEDNVEVRIIEYLCSEHAYQMLRIFSSFMTVKPLFPT